VLPDLRGVFLRGKNQERADGFENPDGDMDVGAIQEDAFQGHGHRWNGFGLRQVFQTGQDGSGTQGGPFSEYDDTVIRNAITDNTYGNAKVSNETRPTNITVLYVMKY
jgi:hypothetical protein